MRGRRHREHVTGVDITPMIDVVFLLIIFFMTTAQFVRMTREKIDLPREKGEQEKQAEEAGLLINLLASGQIVIASDELSVDQLEFRVRQEIAKRPHQDATQFKMLIRADRKADTAHLNEVLKRLRGLGVGAARVATEVPR